MKKSGCFVLLLVVYSSHVTDVDGRSADRLTRRRDGTGTESRLRGTKGTETLTNLIRRYDERWTSRDVASTGRRRTSTQRRQLVSLRQHDNLTVTLDKFKSAIAVLNNELYVDADFSPVEVYDTSNLNLLRKWRVPEQRGAQDMASCPQCDVIYVADVLKRQFLVIDESGLKFRWNFIEEEAFGLSVNSRLNLVATFPGLGKLREFTPNGQLVREITLQSDILRPWHAIQLDDDRFAVVHGYLSEDPHRLCIVDSNGAIIESYGGTRGSNEGQMNRPWRLLKVNESLIVADHLNHRLLSFNLSPLTYVGELISTQSEGLRPHGMAASDDGKQLFALLGKQIRVFDFVWN